MNIINYDFYKSISYTFINYKINKLKTSHKNNYRDLKFGQTSFEYIVIKRAYLQ